MAIYNDSGETVINDLNQIVTPSEYTGLTVMQIYDAWAVELGLDPTVNKNDLPQNSMSINQFNTQFTPFYEYTSVVRTVSAGLLYFYSFDPTLTGSEINKVFELLTDQGNDVVRGRLLDNYIPAFSLGIADSEVNQRLDVGTNNSNESGIIYFFNIIGRFNTVYHSAIRILLSGQIDIVSQRQSGTSDYVCGIIDFSDGEGTINSSLETPIDSTSTNAYQYNDDDLHYHRSVEVERAFIKGIVQKGTGNYLARDVTVLDSQTKGVRNRVVSSAADGTFKVSVTPDTEYMVICEDQGTDPANALVFDRVVGKPDA